MAGRSERKLCRKCGETKPVSAFYLHDGKPKTPCKACRAEHGRLWRAENQERVNAHRRTPEMRKILSAKMRERNLSKFYGLTQDGYNTILAYQGGGCAICGRKQKPGGKSLHVDHRHTSGLVSGILCWHCNHAIGKLRDSPELLRKAAIYLEDPPATKALGRETYGQKGRINTKKRKKT